MRVVSLTPPAAMAKGRPAKFGEASAGKTLTYPQQLLASRLYRPQPGTPCPVTDIAGLRAWHAIRFKDVAKTVKPEKYPLNESDYRMLDRLMRSFFYAPLAQAVTGSSVNPMPDDYIERFRSRQLPELLGYQDVQEYEADMRRLLEDAFRR